MSAARAHQGPFQIGIHQHRYRAVLERADPQLARIVGAPGPQRAVSPDAQAVVIARAHQYPVRPVSHLHRRRAVLERADPQLTRIVGAPGPQRTVSPDAQAVVAASADPHPVGLGSHPGEGSLAFEAVDPQLAALVVPARPELTARGKGETVALPGGHGSPAGTRTRPCRHSVLRPVGVARALAQLAVYIHAPRPQGSVGLDAHAVQSASADVHPAGLRSDLLRGVPVSPVSQTQLALNVVTPGPQRAVGFYAQTVDPAGLERRPGKNILGRYAVVVVIVGAARQKGERKDHDPAEKTCSHMWPPHVCFHSIDTRTHQIP